jgi:putative ABC transport system permease protein
MVPVRYNFRSMLVRRATTIATAGGIGLVVFILSAALMLSAGLEQTLGASGREDVAIVLRKGAGNELGSGVQDNQIGLIQSAAGVAKDADGQPIAVGESVVVAMANKIGTDGLSNVMIRGVPAGGQAFRGNISIVEGRSPKPGSDEAMVGARIAGRFEGVDLGKKYEIKKNRYLDIVGVFEDGGSSYESEIWTDVDTVRTSFGRTGAVSSVRVKLDSPAQFDAFKGAIESDRRIGLEAFREAEYYEKQSEGTSIFISILGSVITVFFSIGAMIGAMNTMYAAVSNRQREIGILRALGFSRLSILLSFVLESTVLSLFGGLIGVAGALALGSVEISMINFASWSEVVFSFEPTPKILVVAFIFAASMGFLGGFLPAVRAARVSAVSAMRGA